LARKFLYIVATLTFLVIAAGFVIRIYESELTELAFVPTAKFERQPAFDPSKYAGNDMWFARPGKTGNPADWSPTGATKPEMPGSAAIFFVHPTSYIGRDHWNAPLNDAESQDRARMFLRGLASPLVSAGEMWAPRYRQAAIGAFLTIKPEGQQALDAAYQDVLLAFDEFAAKVQKDRPIILAGHSQGALHLTNLLKDRVAGKPTAKRMVAVYAAGWPISMTADLPQMAYPLALAVMTQAASWHGKVLPNRPNMTGSSKSITPQPDLTARRARARRCCAQTRSTAARSPRR